MPFVGTQVTTKNAPGPASYQVTGLKSGQYCGGAVVNVVFAAGGRSVVERARAHTHAQRRDLDADRRRRVVGWGHQLSQPAAPTSSATVGDLPRAVARPVARRRRGTSNR